MKQIIVVWQDKVKTSKNRNNKASSIKTFFKNNQIYVLIIGSIVISLFLTSVSLWLYVASGTQQLDLSRPGYKSVQDKVKRDLISDSYPANGPMSIEEIKKFNKLYGAELDKINKGDAFSGDPLNPENLGLNVNEDVTQDF